MIIYLDLVIILNFFFDFLNLFLVNLTLKRNTSLKRLILASLVGELSILVFYINNYLLIFIFKIFLALLINILAFKYRNFYYTLHNLAYFYMISIILGGFIYALKLEAINYSLIILISPIILYIYYKQSITLKNNYQNYYKLTIYFDSNNFVNVTGYLDTGNVLKDPITNKSIILLDKRLAKGLIKNKSPIYVPYSALNYHGLLKCFKPLKITINNQSNNNLLVGIMDNKIGLNGVDCIINTNILEGLHD